MYRFVVSSLSGSNIAELVDASSRQLVIPLSKTATASFKLSLSHELLPNLLTQDLLLKVYDGGTLRFHGPIVNVQAVGSDSDRSVAVAAADPSWRFQYRLSGKSSVGYTLTSTNMLSFANTLIGSANSLNDTQVLTTSQTCTAVFPYTAGPYKPLNECIDDLSRTNGGFEWRILPSEYGAVGTNKIGTFDGADVIGTSQPDAVLEYGGSLASIKSFDLTRDWTSLTNASFHLYGSGGDSNYVIGGSAGGHGYDATSVAARGLYETVADASDLSTVSLRQQLVDTHVATRKDPRVILQFTPDVRDSLARFGQDYQVGDSVHARVTIDGNTMVDGLVRVYQMTIDIDDNGIATYTPLTDASQAL